MTINADLVVGFKLGFSVGFIIGLLFFFVMEKAIKGAQDGDQGE